MGVHKLRALKQWNNNFEMTDGLLVNLCVCLLLPVYSRAIMDDYKSSCLIALSVLRDAYRNLDLV